MQLRDLQQKTALEMLRILLEEGELDWSELLKSLPTSQHPAYKARHILLKARLIEIFSKEKKNEIFFRLTDRGRRVAENLVEVEKILSEI
jgi:predicted transcriptional regulator